MNVASDRSDRTWPHTNTSWSPANRLPQPLLRPQNKDWSGQKVSGRRLRCSFHYCSPNPFIRTDMSRKRVFVVCTRERSSIMDKPPRSDGPAGKVKVGQDTREAHINSTSNSTSTTLRNDQAVLHPQGRDLVIIEDFISNHSGKGQMQKDSHQRGWIYLDFKTDLLDIFRMTEHTLSSLDVFYLTWGVCCWTFSLFLVSRFTTWSRFSATLRICWLVLFLGGSRRSENHQGGHSLHRSLHRQRVDVLLL